LFSFISANKTVNQDIQQLHAECESLRLEAESLSRTLYRPELATFHEAELWNSALQAIENAEAPLKRLEETMQGLHTSHRVGWTMGDMVRVLKKDFKINSVSELRQQLQTHFLVLNGIKQEMNLLVAGKSHHTSLQELSDLRMENRAKETIQSTNKVSPNSRNVTRDVARQMKQKVEPQPEVSEDVTIPHDHLPDTPLNDERVSVATQSEDEVPPGLQKTAQTQGKESTDVLKSEQESRVVTRSRLANVGPPVKPSLLEASKRLVLGRTYLTPLQFAIWNNKLETVRALIAKGADVNEPSGNGDYALLMICEFRHQSGAFTAIVEAGADVNASNSCGNTALHEVAWHGELTLMKALIDAGADVSAANGAGWTPLHHAARNGHLDCTKALIQAGANVDSGNVEGCTPLHDAVQFGHEECMQALIEARASVNEMNKRGNTPLHAALRIGHLQCTKALLEAGAEANAVNSRGETPIYQAASLSDISCTEALIEAGAELNTGRTTVYYDDTPLHEAARCGKSLCMIALIQAGAELNKVNERGDTPLHIVVEQGDLPCTKALLEAGAHLNTINKDGRTALGVARQPRHDSRGEDLVKLLVEHGALRSG